MLTNKMPKNAKIFYCEKCDFKCSKETDYNNHFSTRKHKVLTCTDNKKNAKICYYECGKSYKHRQSLHIHKKKCTYQPSHDTEI